MFREFILIKFGFMDHNADFETLYSIAGRIVCEEGRADVRLKKICKLLSSSLDYYNWVGFYLSEPGRRELVLGPYVGAPTDHIRIPYGRGVCGRAADTKEPILVQDVGEESNYLSCSVHVRAEIVVPVLRKEVVVAEIDVDSHRSAPFTIEDERFLGSLAVLVEPIIY